MLRVAVAQPTQTVGTTTTIVERVTVHGNPRIERDAVLTQIGSKVGRVLDPAQLGADIRAVWKLGVFSDVRAFTDTAPGGGVAITFEVTERPTIRKVLIS